MEFKEKPYQQSVDNVQQEAEPTELQVLELQHKEIMAKLMEIESAKSPGELFEDFEYMNLAKILMH